MSHQENTCLTEDSDWVGCAGGGPQMSGCHGALQQLQARADGGAGLHDQHRRGEANHQLQSTGAGDIVE